MKYASLSKISPRAIRLTDGLGSSMEHLTEAHRILYSMGFAAKEHIILAEKLLAYPARECFDRVIHPSKHGAKANHLHVLRNLIGKVRRCDIEADEIYARCHQGSESRLQNQVDADQQLLAQVEHHMQSLFPHFAFEWVVLEEMALVAEKILERFRSLLGSAGNRSIRSLGSCSSDPISELEALVRMPALEFCSAAERLGGVMEKLQQTGRAD